MDTKLTLIEQVNKIQDDARIEHIKAIHNRVKKNNTNPFTNLVNGIGKTVAVNTIGIDNSDIHWDNPEVDAIQQEIHDQIFG